MARYFVQFQPNSSLADKLMVFTGMTEQEVRNEVNREYKDAVMRIYDEPSIARILPNIYACKEQWVVFGVPCVFTKTDCNGNSTGEVHYPVSKNVKPFKPHSVSLADITKWFDTAKPHPTDKDVATQLAAHFEEIAEMLAVFKSKNEATDLQNQFVKAFIEVHTLSQMLYQTKKLPELATEEKVALLDSIADQTVTLAGVAYFNKFDLDGALTEVNQSNWSKFEDGKPILNENKKIMKGKDYFKPSLEQFIGE